MNAPINLTGMTARALDRARVELIAKAAEARPGDVGAARRYLAAAIDLDDRDHGLRAARLYSCAAPGDAHGWHLLGDYCMQRNLAADAVEAFTRACALDPGHSQFASAHGFALRAVERQEEADRTFARSLDLDPANPHAARGWGQALLRRQDWPGLKRHCEELMPQIGVRSWLVAQYMIAGAMLGHRQTLSHLLDYDRFVEESSLDLPPGFASLEDFNEALLSEMAAFEAPGEDGVAMDVVKEGRRLEGFPLAAVEVLGEAGAPAARALLEQAVRKLDAYAAALGDCLLARMRPEQTRLSVDAILSDARTHLAPHTHACSWLNLVYYLKVPETVRQDSRAGCMEFVPPLHKAPVPKGIWPSRLVFPVAGKFVIFPGSYYHRVNATRQPGLRIALSFDIYPMPDCYLRGVSHETWLDGIAQE